MKKFEIRAVSLEREIEFTIEHFKLDVILLDVLVSGYDGRGICRKIKSTNKTVSVILLSTDPRLLKHYEG